MHTPRSQVTAARARLRLVYLYGDLMNLYGDRGNIITLQRRCAWRNIDLEVVEATIGDRIEPDKSDIFFFGGGQDREQEVVSRDLALRTGEAIQEAVEDGAALLAVCGGYQLLGYFFRTADGTEIPGVGLFDAYTIAGPARNVGNVVVDASLDGQRHTLVGFENHSGRTYLGQAPSGASQAASHIGGCPQASGPHRTVPLGRVLVGNGNNGEDHFEGAQDRHAIGTYLHGPVLPKNPWLADWLIQAALRRRLGEDASLLPLDDTEEVAAHDTLMARVLRSGNVRTSIR
ncbi:MAG: glutamine amidotransferase [Chloroflexi bacterium]|nr:glutamine amidotransferase [Chloroflexota bacterium]